MGGNGIVSNQPLNRLPGETSDNAYVERIFDPNVAPPGRVSYRVRPCSAGPTEERFIVGSSDDNVVTYGTYYARARAYLGVGGGMKLWTGALRESEGTKLASNAPTVTEVLSVRTNDRKKNACSVTLNSNCSDTGIPDRIVTAGALTKYTARIRWTNPTNWDTTPVNKRYIWKAFVVGNDPAPARDAVTLAATTKLDGTGPNALPTAGAEPGYILDHSYIDPYTHSTQGDNVFDDNQVRGGGYTCYLVKAVYAIDNPGATPDNALRLAL